MTSTLRATHLSYCVTAEFLLADKNYRFYPCKNGHINHKPQRNQYNQKQNLGNVL